MNKLCDNNNTTKAFSCFKLYSYKRNNKKQQILKIILMWIRLLDTIIANMKKGNILIHCWNIT